MSYSRFRSRGPGERYKTGTLSGDGKVAIPIRAMRMAVAQNAKHHIGLSIGL